MDRYTVLFETARPDEVEAIRRALGEAAIPYRSGLMAEDPPRVVFSVPSDRIGLARATIYAHVADGAPGDDLRSDRSPDRSQRAWSAEDALDGLEEALGAGAGTWSSTLGSFADPAGDDDEDRADTAEAPGGRTRFPWAAVAPPLALLAVHVVVVLLTGGAFEAGRALLERGVLLRGGTLFEPWRFVTSLVLHADLRHALANGLSMTVFAVPLLERLGLRRTAWIYLLSGVGGSLTALSLARPGTAFLGSSGAVAGLFGAWAVTAFDRAGADVLPWRTRVRTAGVALLVLPSLLTPFTPDGRPVSVASHVGGLVTGMLIGAVLSGWVGRIRGDDPMFDA